MDSVHYAHAIIAGTATGEPLVTEQALSLWGGVDPMSSQVIDVRHALHGQLISGKVLAMPTTCGSCTGSAIVLDLALSGRAPSALIFHEAEDVATLGALVAEIFGKSIPVLRVSIDTFNALKGAEVVTVEKKQLKIGSLSIPICSPDAVSLDLTDKDRVMLAGEEGPAVAQAMRILCAMAVQQGANRLIDVTQAHVDGCIYASPANLIFAQTMADMGGKVRIPTTMNAISVELANWRSQGVAQSFGEAAAALANAYVRMGCSPSFTCAPYLLDSAPVAGEFIGWSESNAVVFANSVIGARTAKHPDFMDICIALTGRAPFAGMYLDANRKAKLILDIDLPNNVDSAFWPLIGYVAGHHAADRVPLLRGIAAAKPSRDALKSLCAAFGTTSAAPMLHVEGVTPEAHNAALPDAPQIRIERAMLRDFWRKLNAGPTKIDLVALGSPHASLDECHAIAGMLADRHIHPEVAVVLTVGPFIRRTIAEDGTLAKLQNSGVKVISDLCWCSISEPNFPPFAKTVVTDSSKYAHYGPGLSGRSVRLASLSDCVKAALQGALTECLPYWLEDEPI